MKKQTVYVPVKSYEDYSVSYKLEEGSIDYVKPQEGYFFTEEQLNELLSNVIKNTLETAAEKAEYDIDGQEHITEVWINKQSILNRFEETYKKHKV